MRTDRLPTICVFGWGGGVMGVGPQVNMFEHVFNDDYQMSVAGVWGSPLRVCVCWGG